MSDCHHCTGSATRTSFPAGGDSASQASARAMKPPILLLDEPTSARCLGAGRDLNLLKAAAGYSLTSILVSHDLAVVAHLCSRIAVMQHGQLVEVLRRPTFQGAVVADYAIAGRQPWLTRAAR
jgi:peptide/nickel transport system ATP-binding protein